MSDDPKDLFRLSLAEIMVVTLGAAVASLAGRYWGLFGALYVGISLIVVWVLIRSRDQL